MLSFDLNARGTNHIHLLAAMNEKPWFPRTQASGTVSAWQVRKYQNTEKGIND